MTTFTCLPTEIVSLVLQHLDNGSDFYECALVNKKWNTVTTPLLWQEPTLLWAHCPTIFFSCLSTANQPIGQHIRKVRLYYGFQYEDKHLLRLIKHAPSLEHLEIGGAGGITDASIEPLARSCPRLTSLFLHASPITHISIDSLNEHCRHLSNLTLIRCYNIPSTVFLRLATCPLQGIRLEYWDDDTSTWDALHNRIQDLGLFDGLKRLAMRQPPRSYVLRLLSIGHARWPYLTHLTLEYPGADYDADRWDNRFVDDDDDVEDSLIPFFQTHPHLWSVSLMGYQLSSRALESMSAFLPKLAFLDINWNRNITAHDVRRLVMHCPLLTFMDLNHCGLRFDDFPELEDIYHKKKNGCRPSPSRLVALDLTSIDRIRGEDVASDSDDDRLEYMRDWWWQ